MQPHLCCSKVCGIFWPCVPGRFCPIVLWKPQAFPTRHSRVNSATTATCEVSMAAAVAARQETPATRGGSRISGKHCDVRTRSLGSLTCQDCFLPAPASFATYFWHAINAERRFTNILLHEPRNALLPKQPSFFMHLCDRRWNPASSAPISLTLPAAVGRGWWFACGGGLE